MENPIINFPVMSDKDIMLVNIERFTDIPFEIKRVYYIYDTKHNVARGFHAHLDLQQVLICVCGSCKVLLDNGVEKTEYELDKPTQGLLIESLIWREIHDFSDNCVLVVLASNYYDEKDYIKNYNDFIIKVENTNTQERG